MLEWQFGLRLRRFSTCVEKVEQHLDPRDLRTLDKEEAKLCYRLLSSTKLMECKECERIQAGSFRGKKSTHELFQEFEMI